MSAEDKKKVMEDMVSDLKGMPEKELMKTWGFALGLMAYEREKK